MNQLNGYIDENAKDDPSFYNMTISDLNLAFRVLGRIPEAQRSNLRWFGGGHWNDMFLKQVGGRLPVPMAGCHT